MSTHSDDDVWRPPARQPSNGQDQANGGRNTNQNSSDPAGPPGGSRSQSTQPTSSGPAGAGGNATASNANAQAPTGSGGNATASGPKDPSGNDGGNRYDDYYDDYDDYERAPYIVQSHMPMPAPFSFKAEDWVRWRNRWQRYASGSGLMDQPEKKVVDTFIYAMGDRAEDLMLSFKMAEGEERRYKPVLEQFNQHFGVRKNVVLERQRFLRRKQESGESVDDFIADLHRLAETCGFKTMKDEFIRDALINGIRDRRLSDSLALDGEMTLTKAAARIRQKEELQRNKAEQPGGSRGGGGDVSFKGGGKSARRNSGKECGKCGRTPQHAFSECPAKGTKCSNCNATGHWSVKCDKKKVHKVGEDDTDDDELFVGATALCETVRVAGVFSVGGAGRSKKRPPWMTKVSVAGRELTLQVDSGADVTVLGQKTFEEAFRGVKLESTANRLRGPDRRRLSVLGVMAAPVEWRGRSATTDVYVIKEDAVNLLGRPAIEDLRMLRWDPDAVVGAAVQDDPGPSPTGDDWVSEFPEVFKGLGCINEKRPYSVVLQKDAAPHAVTAPRRVSVQLRDDVKAELQRMVDMGVISPVDEATEWCAPMVVVPKANGSVRICVDYTELNRSVRRERYMMPAVDELLALLGNAKWFTKLDANHGYYQLVLTEASKKLTTFITPFGRFCYNRLPMGLTSAGEHFQKRISEVLAGLDGVIHLADDILVHGDQRGQHDVRLRAVFVRLKDQRVTLNRKKCEFATQRTRFLGYIIDAGLGILPDPAKVEAIVGMPRPACAGDVNRFLGMVNYQLKFLEHLSTMTQPLRDLRREDVEFVWLDVHDKAFQAIKDKLVSAPALAFFDPKKRSRVSADASSFGLGAVLEQLHESWEYNGAVLRDIWRAVYYASRTLTDTESRYAQIEKEALALTWACEKLEIFIIGDSDLVLRTDHKPLLSLLGQKPLSELTPRLQRLRMRLMRFTFTIEHVSGKAFMVPDTLSRAPLPTAAPAGDGDLLADNDVELYARAVLADIPLSDPVLLAVREAQQSDPLTQTVLQHVRDGWPHSRDKDVSGELAPFFRERASLTTIDGLLVCGARVYVPRAMRADVLVKLHHGHLGETKCLARARATVWWPGISDAVRQTCAQCDICLQHRPQPVEPLMLSKLPCRPWQRLAADLCQRGADHYLVIVDYYSRYPEVAKLGSLGTTGVVNKMRDVFARHGVPEELRADNGPQFASAEFKAYATEEGFKVTLMSPHHSQSNGQAEAAVKVVKSIIKKDSDPYRGLLAYRTAPLESGYSPAELLMNRRLRTALPILGENLRPSGVDSERHRAAVVKRKERAKADFDRRHRVKELRPLQSGELVWVRDMKAPGVVVKRRSEPRSYDVECEGHGLLRRNRAFIQPLSRCAADPDDDIPCEPKEQDDGPPPPPPQREQPPCVVCVDLFKYSSTDNSSVKQPAGLTLPAYSIAWLMETSNAITKKFEAKNNLK
ncbi:uncharacterized protein LOC117646566 [Thrips palmi]|uniref:RNA-directed DNA polymerase n=1 Tax=Thrips palmi TaxID=161013 RepID=A0A6P8YTW7_THRPL|nr:uncharacterized protein LOC117646566 [Thrips palmi]